MIKAVLFDWGDTLMVDYLDQKGPMYTWSRIATTKHAKECLQTITKSIPCFLATNADDSSKGEIDKALKKVGLDNYITDIFCSKEIGFRKPSKEYFKTILNRLELPPNEVIFIGDDLEKDVYGARDSGLIPIQYDPYNLSHYGGVKIDDLRDLKSIIDALR